MFEAKLIQGSLLKRVLETVKNLLNEATLVCSKEGIQLEAMDHYRVSLMTVIIRANSFDKFQCDRTIRTGVDLAEMSKILCCCCTEKDIITMKVDDAAEIFTFTFCAIFQACCANIFIQWTHKFCFFFNFAVKMNI